MVHLEVVQFLSRSVYSFGVFRGIIHIIRWLYMDKDYTHSVFFCFFNQGFSKFYITFRELKLSRTYENRKGKEEN